MNCQTMTNIHTFLKCLWDNNTGLLDWGLLLYDGRYLSLSPSRHWGRLRLPVRSWYPDARLISSGAKVHAVLPHMPGQSSHYVTWQQHIAQMFLNWYMANGPGVNFCLLLNPLHTGIIVCYLRKDSPITACIFWETAAKVTLNVSSKANSD